MKRFVVKLFLKLLIISLILTTFMFGVNDVAMANGSYSCEIVIEKTSGRILHAVNENLVRSMASTTKIATCITAIENYDLNKRITVNKEWTGIEGSSIYLREGEVFTVEELLYGLMLRSGNDCAVTLACGLAGSVENFVLLMNEIAVNSGAKDTTFKNPHGLDEEGHQTTAYDLAMITRYAMNNETFKKIVSTKKITIGDGESKRVLLNKNKMLVNYQYANGVKTGYTKKSGRCLVSSADKEGFELICVVLNCGPMFERSQTLFDECYHEYKRIKLLDKEKSVCEVQTKYGKVMPAYVKNDFFYPLKSSELNQIKIEIESLDCKKILPKFGQECGSIKIFFAKRLIFDEKIYTILK